MDPCLLAFFIPCFLFMSHSNYNPLLHWGCIFMSLFSNLCFTKGISGLFAWKPQIPSQNHKNHYHPIKSPNFSWPILGFLPQMGYLAHRNLASTATSIGATRLMAITLGSVPTVISSHPETAREILCGPAFSDRPNRESTRLLMFDRAMGFSPSGGNYWRHLRRIATSYMFSPKKVASLEGHRQAIANRMVERVEREMSERGFVDVRGVLQKGSLESVVECVFGSVAKGEELGWMVKEGYEVLGEFNWGDYLGLGFLFGFGGVMRRRCTELGRKVRVLVSEIIRERRESGDFIGRNDFLSELLSLPQEDQLCDSDMVAVLWEMVFRGIDNIAILLEWTMARLTLHQDTQARVQQEIHSNISPGAEIRDSDIPNLPYLQATVKEVLRLHPPGPLLSWARLAIQDVHVDSSLIPAGTTAMVNMWAIAHDPSIWSDPWEFKPERFLEQDQLGLDFPITGTDLRLAPFGSGRRACPGRALGLAAVHGWVARLVQKFKWVPAAGSVDLRECLKLSMEMKTPLKCCVLGVSAGH